MLSGCTNRAAGLLTQKNPDDKVLACTARTFEKTCAHGDEWGCSMHGYNLMQGQFFARDLKKGRQVLGRACTHGPSDPACQSARELLSEIDAYELDQKLEPADSK